MLTFHGLVGGFDSQPDISSTVYTPHGVVRPASLRRAWAKSKGVRPNELARWGSAPAANNSVLGQVSSVDHIYTVGGLQCQRTTPGSGSLEWILEKNHQAV